MTVSSAPPSNDPPLTKVQPVVVSPFIGMGRFWLTLAVLALVTTWAYADTIAKIAERWAGDPQYSHGYIVPVFAAYLLYRRRAMIGGQIPKPSLWAFFALALAMSLRFGEAVYYYNGLDPLSLVPAAAAVLLASGGRLAWRWGWPAAGFLVFMVPLPYRMQTLLSGQLQTLATQVSSAILVTLGYPAVTEGNVILLGEFRVGVVEACSGLGMVVTFAALSAGFALLIRSATWVKVALLAGALPVALIANIARICGTGMLLYADHSEAAQHFYHDLAGWIMIPFGCVLILIELWILDRVLLAAAPDDPQRRILELSPLTAPLAPRR